jgi:hypothetical protein
VRRLIFHVRQSGHEIDEHLRSKFAIPHGIYRDFPLRGKWNDEVGMAMLADIGELSPSHGEVIDKTFHHPGTGASEA